MNVDVLLVNPGSPGSVYQELSNTFSAIEPPSLLAMFASYLRLKGVSIGVVDAPAFNMSPEMVAKHVYDNYKPTLIVMVIYGFQPSASSQNMTAAGETCTALKQLDPTFKIMMTGTHPAALPSRTIREEEIDFVCSAEGPQTIYNTFLALKAGSKDFSSVPSLHYKRGDIYLSTPNGLLLDDLDNEMPGAAWDLLPMENYRAHNWHCFEDINNRQPYASIHTSLGCPYKCSFCCINAPFGKSSYRMWSPEAVIKEIDILVNKYGVKNIKFVDEMFVLKKSHVIGICDLIIERGYDLNIWAYARIDTVKEEFLEKLNRAGFRWLALGIESGSKAVLKSVEKGRFDGDQTLKVVNIIRDAGINIIGNYIFGLPEDTYESMNETLDLAIEANCEFANFYSAMAYPGSKLYNMAIEKGWELPDSWIGYSQHSYETKPLRTEALPASEVLRFRDEAFHRYFNNPRYLSMIKTKFGQQVHDHILEMTKIKLRRQLVEEADNLIAVNT